MNLKQIEEALSKITIPEVFGVWKSDDYEPEPCEYVISQVRANGLSEVVYFHGISKMVVCSHTEDFVIKIPFTGNFGDMYDEENDTTFEEFSPFEGADSGWDYCKDEVQLYKQLSEKGLQDFLAATEFFCLSKNKHPIYKQEKVIPYCDHAKGQYSKKTLDSVKQHKLDKILPLPWMAECIDRYGLEKTLAFNAELESNYTLNSDLHEGNIGFRITGEPIILDYSGFEY